MKGQIEFRACNQDYRCGQCEFDQYFSDQYSVHAIVKPVDALDIEGFRVPQGYYLHRGHAWVKIERGSAVRVGLDDFALRLLGPLDSIQAPLVGKQISQNNPGIMVRRGSHLARVLSPVRGVVTAVNHRLTEEGSLANRDPYAEGWIVTVHAENLRQDLKHLMIGGETQTFMQEQVEDLHDAIEDVAGPLAADGGQLGYDICGARPDIGWERLARRFLGT
jgi:glycine cleavage system H lipoate-binding protein